MTSEATPRRPLRRAARWLGGLALLLLALLLLARAALWLPSLRQALLARVESAARERLGWALEIDDFDLRLAAGEIGLEGIRLGAPDAPPALTVRSLRARAVLPTLLGEEPRIRRLVVDGPRLDLAAPRPGPAAGGGDSPSARRPTVERLEVRGAEVVGGAAPAALAPVAGGWSARAIDVGGSLVDGAVRLTVESGAVEVERQAAAPLGLALRGKLEGALEGPLRLERLSLAGEGLYFEVSAEVGLRDSQPLHADFELRAVPVLLLALAESGPPLEASGRVDLRAGAGALRLEAPALPAEILGPWLGAEVMAERGLAGLVLAVDGDLALGPGDLTRVGGRLDARLARGQTELAELAVEPTGRSVVAPGLELPLRVRILPREPGRRELSGTLLVADRSDPGTLALADGRLALDLPDLAGAAAAAATAWPGLPLASVDRRLLRGALTASARFDGPVRDPFVAGEASWRPDADSELRAHGEGRPAAGRGTVEIRSAGFRLASVDGALAGLVRGEGRWTADAAGHRVSLRLEAEEVGAAAETPWLDRARLAADLEGGALLVSSLELDGRGHRASAELRAEIDNGTLLLRVPRLAVDGLRGALEADAPLASLSALGAGALADRLPGPRAGGPVGLRWRIERGDWRPLAALVAGDAAPEALLFASQGSADVDVEHPLRSRGELEIAGLEAAVAGETVTAEGPLRLRLAAGRLEIPPARLVSAGRSLDLGGSIDLATEWTAARPPLEAVAAWDLGAAARVPVNSLVAVLGEGTSGGGEVAAELTVAGSGADPRLELRLRGPDAALTLPPPRALVLAEPELVVRLAGPTVELERASVRVDEARFEAEGSAELGDEEIAADLRRLALAGVEGSLEVRAPRGYLPWGAAPAPGAGPGPLALVWRFPEADWTPVLEALAGQAGGPTLRAATSGSLLVDPVRPTLATAELEIAGLVVTTEGHRLAASGPLRLRLADGVLFVDALRLVTDEQPFVLDGQVVLDRDWTFERPLLDAAAGYDLHGEGTVLAELLNPFLGGGAARGPIGIEAELRGAGVGTLRLRGPQASLYFTQPYVTEITRPELELVLGEDGVARLSGGLRLNEGEVALSGAATGDGFAELRAEATGVRYRFDYGLLALLAADLTLTRGSEGGAVLSGDLEVDQGILTRNIALDLDLLRNLMTPVDLSGTEESPLAAVALDLSLSTGQGVRVKNNLADLLVTWDPIAVGGTLAAPVLRGRLEVEPGGRVFAYGQTVRLDSAWLDYPGEAGAAPALELETTSSLEDPTISRLSGDDPFAGREGAGARMRETGSEGTEAADFDTEAMTTVVGQQVASRLTEALAGGRISVRPVLVFGETDPGGRLTLSRDLSPQVALAASIDLRNAEAQTYLLEVHELQFPPSFRGQVFTTDEASRGVTAQQRLQFGGARRQAANGPRIARIRVDPPPRVSKRSLRKAIGYEKGDPLPPGGAFEIEVEVGDYLRRRGYAAARVDAEVRPRRRGRVEVELLIEPGPHASFEFTGDRLPKPLRQAVTSLYRPDFYEDRSLEEMRLQAVRAYRSLGHLEPAVEVTVERLPGSGAGEARRVTVHGAGGPRIEPAAPEFPDLPPDEAAILAGRFATALERVELAAGAAGADQRALETLRALGYRQPRVVSREVAAEGRRLIVRVERGERRRLAAIEIVGVAGDEEEAFRQLVPLAVGDPVRLDRVARGRLALQDALRQRGHAEALVASRQVEADDGGGPGTVLRYEVVAGPVQRLEALEFAGLRSTRRRWVADVAGLEAGGILRRSEVFDARRRLYRTGLFDRIDARVEPLGDGASRVIFDLAERSRFQLAYGLRWDSEDGASALVEGVDRNFLGRGFTLGVRTLYASDDASLRSFVEVPRLFGTRASIELFGLVREQDFEEGLEVRTVESTLQLSYPVTRHVTARVYGRYRYRLTTKPPTPFFPFPIEERVTTPFLGAQFIYDSRSNEPLPARGLLASADLSFSDDVLGSDFRFARFFGQVNTFRPVGRLAGRRLVWAQSARVGLAEDFDRELLFDFRFFAGGEYSVRGYANRRLGPQEVLGSLVRPLGGTALLVVNEELRFDLLEPVSGVVFVDAGNVWADPSDLGSGIVTSMGVGLRATSPLGLLRLDLARALDGREFDPEFKLYLGFGSTF